MDLIPQPVLQYDGHHDQNSSGQQRQTAHFGSRISAQRNSFQNSEPMQQAQNLQRIEEEDDLVLQNRNLQEQVHYRSNSIERDVSAQHNLMVVDGHVQLNGNLSSFSRGSIGSNNPGMLTSRTHRSANNVLNLPGAPAAAVQYPHGNERRNRLRRVQSFVFRQFDTLRDNRLQQIINKIIFELVVIVSLVILNLYTRFIEVKTLYSRNEQIWVCETLTELTFVIAGFTIFRALTIDLGSATNEFIAKSIGLIFFQLAMNISFIIIQFRGISLNKEVYEKEGYQTKDGNPENMFIHSIRICLLVLGSLVSLSVFIIIFSIFAFVISIARMQSNGELNWDTLSVVSERWQINRELIRNMKHFPFGDILFKEATECAICLEPFKGQNEIVQLKCSKYHIFHHYCLEKMLSQHFEGERSPRQFNETSNKCPLCRELIQIQDPPILS